MSRRVRAGSLSALGSAAVLGLVLIGGVAPANATTGVLTAPQAGYSTVYYSTPRTNTYNRNAVSVRVTDSGSDYTNTWIMALRPTTVHSGTYARTGSFPVGTSYHTVYSDGGPAYVSGGTFYMSVSIDGCMGSTGDCFGESSGFSTWYGNIQYNIPVP